MAGMISSPSSSSSSYSSSSAAATSPPSSKVVVHIVSDVLCPWCFVGKRQLEDAASRTNIPVEIRWLPFFLSPSCAKGGVSLRNYYGSKYGDAGLQRYDSSGTCSNDMQPNTLLDLAGAPYDIKFRMDRMVFDTMDCHRLMEWCYKSSDPEERKEGVRKANNLMEYMFVATFQRAVNLDLTEELLKTAVASGLDELKVQSVLSDPSICRQEVDEQIHHMKAAPHQAFSGVPFFTAFDNKGKVFTRFSGALGIDVFEEMLRIISGQELS